MLSNGCYILAPKRSIENLAAASWRNRRTPPRSSHKNIFLITVTILQIANSHFNFKNSFGVMMLLKKLVGHLSLVGASFFRAL